MLEAVWLAHALSYERLSRKAALMKYAWEPWWDRVTWQWASSWSDLRHAENTPSVGCEGQGVKKSPRSQVHLKMESAEGSPSLDLQLLEEKSGLTWHSTEEQNTAACRQLREEFNYSVDAS